MKAVAIALALGALGVACAASPDRASAPGRATGVVYHDRDGDGQRDRFEWGISGVAVSNGRDVVETDLRGRYELAVGDDTIVFVVKPRGWRTPLDENLLPRFYYVHKPEGSPPGLAFPGVEPTGPLPASIDFPLRRQSEPESFRMVLFGDTQPYSVHEIDQMSRDVLPELIGVDAAFGITLGDVVGDDLSLFEPLNRAVSRIGIPWYNVLGNHDLNFETGNDEHSDETWERVYGPASYAFQYASVHFVILDDVLFGGGDLLDYIGGLREDQLSFVANYLDRVPRDDLVVVAMHIPLAGNGPGLEVRERRELLGILSRHPHTFSVSAHTHLQEHLFFGADDGFTGPLPHHHLNHATVAGSWWLGADDDAGLPHATMRCGAPNGYSLLRFDGSRYTVHFRAARRPADHQMRIYAADSVASADASGSEVLVNVFAGSARSRVEMRFREVGDWTPLVREARPDPLYVALVEREKKSGERGRRPLPPVRDSPHLWVGHLPADPPAGTLTLEVRTIDMFGQVFTDHRLIRID